MQGKLKFKTSTGEFTEITIPDISDFEKGNGYIQISTGEYILLEPDVPVTTKTGEWEYKVKIVK